MKMITINIFSLLVVILFLHAYLKDEVLQACNANTRCFVCNTNTGSYADRCGDEFRLTSTEASKCPNGGTCRKTRGTRDAGGRSEIEITRGCVDYKSEGCEQGTHLGISATICYCNEQLCNSCNNLTPGKWMSSLLAIVIGLFARLFKC